MTTVMGHLGHICIALFLSTVLLCVPADADPVSRRKASRGHPGITGAISSKRHGVESMTKDRQGEPTDAAVTVAAAHRALMSALSDLPKELETFGRGSSSGLKEHSANKGGTNGTAAAAGRGNGTAAAAVGGNGTGGGNGNGMVYVKPPESSVGPGEHRERPRPQAHQNETTVHKKGGHEGKRSGKSIPQGRPNDPLERAVRGMQVCRARSERPTTPLDLDTRLISV